MSNAPDRRPEDPAPADGSPAATGKRSTDGAEPTSSASDPAPYAWLDDNARMAGAISPGVTTAYGVFFLASAGVLVIVSFAYAALPWLWIALGLGLFGSSGVAAASPGCGSSVDGSESDRWIGLRA